MVNGFAGLTTEASDPRYADIDQLSVTEIATLMNAADATVPGAVGAVIPDIAGVVEATVDRLRIGGRLIYVGAGTSGRLAVLDASECPPTFGTDPALVQGLIAGGLGALVRSIEGAEDDPEGGAADIGDMGIGPNDVVIGISASGHARYVIGAVAEARERGAVTVGLCCSDDGPLLDHVDHRLRIVVGPEVIAGSTRLKAGTATKLVLNMISTITMVKLGRTYGNRMIELSASNDKLADRARRIIVDVTGVTEDQAAVVLAAADRNVKVAIVMIEHDLDADGARAMLAANGGRFGPTHSRD
jgi:N-acetylmuramic acid 6-phosphate etherase